MIKLLSMGKLRCTGQSCLVFLRLLADSIPELTFMPDMSASDSLKSLSGARKTDLFSPVCL